MSGGGTYTPDLEDFRWYNNDSSDLDLQTAIDTQGTNITLATTAQAVLRVRIGEIGGKNGPNTSHKFQYRKNTGTWTDLTVSSADCRLFNGLAANATAIDGTTNIERLTGGGGAYDSTGGYYMDGVTGTPAGNLAADDRWEQAVCVQLVNADVAHNDTIQFRVRDDAGSTFTDSAVPQITVNKNIYYPDQTGFRFYEDDGTAIAATNTQPSRNQLIPDVNYRCRILFKNQNGTASPASTGIKVQFRQTENSSWADLTTTSTPVQSVNSTNVTDGAATSQLIGAGTFDGGFYDEQGDGGGLFTHGANGEREHEFTFKMVPGTTLELDRSNGTRSIDFRFVDDGGDPFPAYTQSCSFQQSDGQDRPLYRWRNDDGSETTATWIAAEGVDISTPTLDTNYRLRFAHGKVAGDYNGNVGQIWQYRKNDGTWTDITPTSTNVRISDSTNIVTPPVATTQLISSGDSRTFTAGEMNDTASNTDVFNTTTNTALISEHEICFQFRSADMSASDKIEIRLIQSFLTTDIELSGAFTANKIAGVNTAAADINLAVPFTAIGLTAPVPTQFVDVVLPAPFTAIGFTSYTVTQNIEVVLPVPFTAIGLTAPVPTVVTEVALAVPFTAIGFTDYLMTVTTPAGDLNLDVPFTAIGFTSYTVTQNIDANVNIPDMTDRINEDFTSDPGWTEFGTGSKTVVGGEHLTSGTGGSDGARLIFTSANEFWAEFDLRLDSGHTSFDDGNVLSGSGLTFSDTTSALSLGFTRQSGVTKFRTQYRNDAGVQNTIIDEVPCNEDQYYRVKLHWKKATTTVSNDGINQIWVDGQQILDITNSDNNSISVDRFAVGTVFADVVTYQIRNDNVQVGESEGIHKVGFSSYIPTTISDVGLAVPFTNIGFTSYQLPLVDIVRPSFLWQAEDFETAGSPDATFWDATGGANSTDHSFNGTQSRKFDASAVITKDPTVVQPYAKTKFYFFLDSLSTAVDGNTTMIANMEGSTWNAGNAVRLWIKRDSGNYYIGLSQGGTSGPLDFQISLDTWYLVEFEVDAPDGFAKFSIDGEAKKILYGLTTTGSNINRVRACGINGFQATVWTTYVDDLELYYDNVRPIDLEVPFTNIGFTGHIPVVETPAGDINLAVPFTAIGFTSYTVTQNIEVGLSVPASPIGFTDYLVTVTLGLELLVPYTPIGFTTPTTTVVTEVNLAVPATSIGFTGHIPVVETPAGDINLAVPFTAIGFTSYQVTLAHDLNVPATAIGFTSYTVTQNIEVGLAVPATAIGFTAPAPTILLEVNLAVPATSIGFTGHIPVVETPASGDVTLNVPFTSLGLTSPETSVVMDVGLNTPFTAIGFTDYQVAIAHDLNVPATAIGFTSYTVTQNIEVGLAVPSTSIGFTAPTSNVVIDTSLAVPVTNIGFSNYPILIGIGVSSPLTNIGFTGYVPSVVLDVLLNVSSNPLGFTGYVPGVFMVGGFFPDPDRIIKVAFENRIVNTTFEQRALKVAFDERSRNA